MSTEVPRGATTMVIAGKGESFQDCAPYDGPAMGMKFNLVDGREVFVRLNIPTTEAIATHVVGRSGEPGGVAVRACNKQEKMERLEAGAAIDAKEGKSVKPIVAQCSFARGQFVIMRATQEAFSGNMALDFGRGDLMTGTWEAKRAEFKPQVCGR